jgi:predicted Zn-dependent peptidase
MKNREFQEIKLNNGISVFHLPDNSVRWSEAQILLPVGFAHCAGNILPGSFHFLEHMVMNRSKLYPELEQFFNWVGIQGGYMTVNTGYLSTQYGFRIAHRLFEQSWKGLYSHVFSPLLAESDITREVSVITNENASQNYYWPSSSSLDDLFLTEWMKKAFIRSKQAFGKVEHLESMTVDYLKKIHCHYFTKDMKVLLAGKYDLPMVVRDMEALLLSESLEKLQVKLPEIAWKNRYATVTDDRKANFYAVGAFSPTELSFREITGLRFLGEFFVDKYNGPLYRWLRLENPWLYQVSFKSSNITRAYWFVRMTFSDKERIDTVKTMIHDKLRASIFDHKTVKAQVKKVLNNVMNDTSTNALIEDAPTRLSKYGYIPTENEWRGIITDCLDQDYITDLYNRYFSPDVTGDCTVLMKKNETEGHATA